MRRFVGAVSIALSVSLLAVPVGATRTAGHSLIDPGRAVGKIELGISLAQVKRVLGKPRSVAREVAYPSGARYVEYQWEVDGVRGVDLWTVGVRNATRGGMLRVIRISTSTPSERTRQGIGVGSTFRRLLRAYPDASCVVRFRVVVASPGANRMTAFLLDGSSYTGRPASYDVIEVLVQRTWFPQGPEHVSCPPGWQREYS